jgi:hypothetical protein
MSSKWERVVGPTCKCKGERKGIGERHARRDDWVGGGKKMAANGAMRARLIPGGGRRRHI